MKRKMTFILFCFFAFSIFLLSEKRRSPLPMEELTNPKGPSYVPIPYPQTRDEIITDLKYAIKTVFNPKMKVLLGLRTSEGDEILLRFLKKDPDVVVSRILRVKNNISTLSHDYTILIALSDLNGVPLGRISLDANGIFQTYISISKKYNLPLQPLKTNNQIKKILSNHSHTLQKLHEIKKIEPFLFKSNIMLSRNTNPIWKITMENAEEFFIDVKNNIYKTKGKMQMSINKMNKTNLHELKNSKDEIIVRDSVNDQVFFLKKINKKKTK